MPFASSRAVQKEMPRLDFSSCLQVSSPENSVEMGGSECGCLLVRLGDALAHEPLLEHVARAFVMLKYTEHARRQVQTASLVFGSKYGA